MVTAKYLGLLADSDPDKAFKVLQSLKYAELEERDVEQVQNIVELGMPEKNKEKKTKNVTEKKEGGAEVFIPMKKRNRKQKLPAGFDPENPGPPVDPERWLPKWQRSKFRKMAKKRGIVLKGAQGDALMDTDVTNFNKETSTAHIEVAQTSKKKNKRR